MNLDVIGYAISTAVLRAFGVPLWAAIGLSFAMGSAFTSDGTRSCLCVQNRPVVGLYTQLAAALSKPADNSLRLPAAPEPAK
jgi:hypothetical protein